MKRARIDGRKLVICLIAMPLVLLLPLLIAREVFRYVTDTCFLADPSPDSFGWFMIGLLLGTVALYTLLFVLVARVLSGKRVVNWRVLRVLGSVALVAGGSYCLYSVACVGQSRREDPRPYEVARYQVYSAFLDHVEGGMLLIEDDTHGLLSYGEFASSPAVESERFQQALNEAQEDYSRHSVSTLPIERKFSLNKKYALVSSDIASEGFRPSNSSEPCKDFEGYDTLVALSTVGFNSDQTFAVLNAVVLRGTCLNAGWSGSRILRKQCGKWEMVKNRLFTDAAIN